MLPLLLAQCYLQYLSVNLKAQLFAAECYTCPLSVSEAVICGSVSDTHTASFDVEEIPRE